jgi:glycosyltransferase involved in cell wall biosynthesis
MRIMLFSHGYPPTISGVTLVVQKIARAMVERGHAVTVVTASEKNLPYKSTDHGVKLERIAGLPNPFWWEGPVPVISTWRLRKLADEFKPDILHTHDNGYQGLVLTRVEWDASQRVITSCYTLPMFFTQFTRLFRMEDATEALIWRYYLSNLNRYQHVVFCTKTHERDFKSHGLLPPTTVISNGVNIQRYCPEKSPGEDIIERYHLPPAPRILSVGRLMKDKRLDLLIQAMRVVCDKLEAHLMIVGRGSERGKLNALVSKLKLEPYIHLLGYVPEEDLPALYRASDLFAIPSMVEVQSIPALQAAATGLPIVAANSAALPELVLQGENGYLVNPNDANELGGAILEILGQTDQARRMGIASLEIGRSHDEQDTFKKYELFYRSLLNGSG